MNYEYIKYSTSLIIPKITATNATADTISILLNAFSRPAQLIIIDFICLLLVIATNVPKFYARPYGFALVDELGRSVLNNPHFGSNAI